MKHLLVVSHSRSGGTAALLEALLAGVRDPAIEGIAVALRDAADVGPDDVRTSDALVIATPVRFGALAGITRDFLERIYYPCLDATRGLPYALAVRGTTDGSGAVREVERIVKGLAWRAIVPALVIERGTAGASSQPPLTGPELAQAYDWGATVAATVAEGLT